MRTGKYIVDMHKSTEETQSIKRMMHFVVMMLLMMCFGVGDVWAEGITVLVEKSDGTFATITGTSGSVDTGITGGKVSVAISDRDVTLTVTPDDNYKIKKDLIMVEKMVNPTDRSNAPRRAPGTARFDVTGPGSTDEERNGWKVGDGTTGYNYTFSVATEYDGAYVTVTFVSATAKVITSLSEISADLTADYELARDIDASDLTASLTGEFTGTLDGKHYTIHHLSHPLFASTNDATIRNINFENVNISTGDANGDAGAITSCAKGATRIYNCGILPTTTEYDAKGNVIGFLGSSVGGSGNVGGLVGKLEGNARVINCFSYANITGGATVGGIVGNNTVATTSADLGTMVMNCMFYGDITSGNKAPIYNGTIITNDGDEAGVNNFNYFWAGASYVKNKQINNYHCALMAETRFLQRFEFYRHLLNSNRELAAWWVKGNDGQKSDMAKWVLEPSQIGSNVPFPILKTPGKYYSVVNYDADHAEEIDAKNEHRNEGRKLTSMGGTGANAGKLAVTIQMGNGAVYNHPTGAAITLKEGETEKTIYLVITDKDTAHYNFNYGKVQLPYYNDYGTNNYTGNRVVTGWKIVSITGGTTGSYSTGADDVTYNESGELTATPYNFADRKCTNKDLYDGTGEGKPGSDRVFNQGAYWDVPDGVTAITIEPYWGKAVYLADPYWDIVYKNNNTDDMATAADVTTIGGGQRFENGQKYNIATRSLDNENGQTVYTSMGNAIASSGSGSALFQGVTGTPANQTVYDYAVVLVGNYHHTTTPNADNSKPYTVTSVDLDGDNEPDYSLMLRFNGRTGFHPVRYDFLNIIGLGMAQKTTGGTGSYNLGIMQPKYWFEVTNTALFRVTQFEYSPSGRAKKPIILQGGVIEQWVTQQQNAGDLVEYFHVGGNVWFKEFHRGSHQDNPDRYTPHPPVSVTGGDFDKFYLTGLYQSQATIYDDNAECYISGGRFGEVAGAGMEGIGTSVGKGNVTWIIDHADIREFYGGGINAKKPIYGNIHTIIKNSYVTQFCGGPKFGDMENGRTVKTIADNCTFGTYFGAGYGGNSYNRYAPKNYNEVINIEWNKWVAGTSYPSGGNYGGYKLEYNSDRGGVPTQFDYQFIPMSGNTNNVARLFIDYISFSLATTHNVTSELTGCKVLGNFYGGGSLGKVEGNATSTLNNCIVNGSAFGAGYSASTPTVEVMPTSGFITEPSYDEQSGSFIDGVVPSKQTNPSTVTYTWQHRNEIIADAANDNARTALAIDKTNHILYTNEDLTTLGTVTGNATLNITGTTTVAGSVYGGGEESGVDGDTEVTIKNGTIGTTDLGGAEYGNVYGGGKGKEDNVTAGQVKGDTKVKIENGTILHNVYGGGAYGSVGDYTYDENDVITARIGGGNTEVYITGGEIGTDGDENGMVFGSSRGDVGDENSIHNKLAWVYDTHVAIGDTAANATVTTETPLIKGSVYGGGENGHNFRSSYVRINGGTIGMTSGGDITDDNGTPDDDEDDIEYSGAAYPYRGNVYGGGCGTDMYDNNTKYNPIAGIVQGNARINMTGGLVVHNMYGAGAMGSVGTETTGGVTTIDISGGTVGVSGTVGDGNVFGAARGAADATSNEYALVRDHTTVNISGGTVKGNVYGGGELGCVGRYKITSDMRNFYWTDIPLANIIANPATYTYNNTGVCNVTITGGTIGTGVVMNTDGSYTNGNVFGAGKGLGDTFWCEKAIVYSTNVSVTDGTVNGNVYGGGEVGRVETNATVTIGDTDDENSDPQILGNVFGGGEGLKTHGYSALVRGNTYVTVQSSANVGHNVYGGGQIAAVGKYYLVTAENQAAHPGLSIGMPYSLVSDELGICNVTIKDNATITGSVFGGGKGKEPENLDFAKPSGSDYHTSSYNIDVHMPKRMMNDYAGKNTYWEFYGPSTNGIIWEYFDTKAKYHTFLETLGLTTQSKVTIGGTRAANGTVTPAGSPTINGDVYGGSESGFVQHNTSVAIAGGTIGTGTAGGDVFGGGLGLEEFAEAGRVRGNATVTIDNGTIKGNVYGGGEFGDVGTINKANIMNYIWTRTDDLANSPGNEKNTGVCTVTINGGVIGTGVNISDDGTFANGNVFGAGKGKDDSFYCEKAMAYSTNVSINKGTVKGTVYGGGQIGRVENNSIVTIGPASGNDVADIKGNVFGAGAGKNTHGYSALVRGNSTVTVQGKAKVGLSVYGGGEIASVGRFNVVNDLPQEPKSGGTCTVTIKGSAEITGDVFGACKGVTPNYVETGTNRSKCMKTYDRYIDETHGRHKDGEVGETWDYIETYPNDYEGTKYVWEYFVGDDGEADYLGFLQTLALTSNTFVTLEGNSTIKESVFGGGERGITLGKVEVDILGGTVTNDVYGGGSLANTNTANWQNGALVSTYPYHEETVITRPTYVKKTVAEGESVEGLYVENNGVHTAAEGTAQSGTDYYELTIPGASVKGLYTRTETDGKYTYTKITNEDATAVEDEDVKYYALYTTTVNLIGGEIGGNAYGGGLGDASTPAYVYGEVKVNLNGLEKEDYDANIHSSYVNNVNSHYALKTTTTGEGENAVTTYPMGAIVSQVFGCNNVNGSPKGHAKVHVFATQNKNTIAINNKVPLTFTEPETGKVDYWSTQATNVGLTPTTIIGEETDDAAKIELLKAAIEANRYDVTAVYGGGNLAAYEPARSTDSTEVRIDGCDLTSIKEVYGGGNAASAPATFVRVNEAYEINEAFGGGNGFLNLPDGRPNPGAHVGYHNYSTYNEDTHVWVDNSDALTPQLRKTSTYCYGSGIARIEITGGTIHAAYGGSNTKGNVREKAISVYQEAGDCPLQIDESYGGGKNSPMDAEVAVNLDCVQNMDVIFGGSKNADVYNNITLNITNGTFQKVFGGNNTSGAINGAITVNIEEKGCQPIVIGELYLGGYKAPYSVYGYEKDDDNNYVTETIDGIVQRKVLTTGTRLYNDPRLNVISATSIGDIFGGGYQAKMVGNPYVNVNMKEGKIEVTKVEVEKIEKGNVETTLYVTEGNTNYIYRKKTGTTIYDPAKVYTEGSGESAKYYVYTDIHNDPHTHTTGDSETTGTLEIGTIGNIYGGGNEADVIGDTHVEIGTGRWISSWDEDEDHLCPIYETEYIDANDNNKNLYYKVKENEHEVYYTKAECNEYNAPLPGFIESGTPLDADQAALVNKALNLPDPNGFKFKKDDQLEDVENGYPYHYAYNATLAGARKTTDVKTQAVWAWYTYNKDTKEYELSDITPTPTRNAAKITGNVFGGGKGIADNFYCNKAMVGGDGAGAIDADGDGNKDTQGGTYVTIANGTIDGDVYGGGEVGRVENNTTVTIGEGDGVDETSATATSAPEIKGSVYGGGAGVETHGYSALVRGNPTVIVQGNAKVRGNVYGGGEIASVARYKVKLDPADPDAPVGWPMGMPYALKNANSGFCTVTIGGYAEIGPEEPMHMVTTSGMPDDAGHVFGAGQGILPKEYTYADDEHKPKRMVLNDDKTASIWEYFANENAYIGFIQTLALASQTEVTIKDHAFVKGSVYGGAFNGIVQYNTHVTIDGDCQIGAGENVNRRYTTDEWAYDGSTTDNSLPECASWPYGKEIPLYENGQQVYDNNNQPVKTKVYLPFDIYDLDANNKPKAASDGHTFYGNVFGGGSGYYPYRRKNASPALDGAAWTKDETKSTEVGQPVDANGYSDGVWLSFAGIVRGNTTVDILGGHILTSAYGGNEQTDVLGSCTVNMSGGTLGVPRTLEQIAAHPVTCYLFGAGKGDQRINFNTWTNVTSVNVNITGGKIYGSVFGGGEDGHVLGDVEMNISDPVELDENDDPLPEAQQKHTKIGTWGTSYVDGNVFGGGRGFSGEAQTAGTVGGNVTMNITGGEMLGSIYGGGRLASVGTQFTSPEDDNYGNFVEDNEDILYTQEECDAYNATLFGYIAAGTALTAAQTETVNAALATNYAENEQISEVHANEYNALLYGYKTTNDIRIPAGTYGHITINISGGTIGNDLESIIPTYGENSNIPGDIMETNIKKWTAEDWAKWKNHNHIPNTDFELYDSVKIENSDQYTYKYHAAHTKGGNVFGGSMGRLKLLNNNTNPIWPKMAQVKTATVTISGNANIKRTVYGGGELGTVRNNTLVTVTGGTVGYDVYGGGYGSDDDDIRTVFEAKELKENHGNPPYTASDYELHTYGFTPMQFAGCVGQSTTVNVTGGYIRKSVYGGGEMASVGIINSRVIPKNNAQINPKEDVVFLAGASESYIFEHFHKHGDADNGFALSWPYHFEYTPTFEGDTHVNVTGGRLGLKANDEDESLTDNGDVYGGGKGIAGDFNDYVFCANVGSAEVNISYPTNNTATPTNYMDEEHPDVDCIAGAVYGGGENGHVIGDAKVTLTNGLVAHSVYGGGSGKGKFPTTLVRIGKDPESTDAKDHYTRDIYSITAGKVFGNTEVEMTGGYVVRNVYGGGNMGSVGKGNYAGGPDDYSTAGYGEKLTGEKNLWDGGNKFSQAFLNSGKCTVKITGGTVGYIASDPNKSMYPLGANKQPISASLPYGNVFGGCRGESAPNIVESPRYLYSPEFFVGYANETEVTIGKPATGTPGQEGYSAASGPTILGSVYGGGMDGHVRRDATVTVYGGEIGLPYTKENRQKVGTLPASPTTDQINSTADLDNIQWLARGNVYGAGSGIGKYKYDFDYDGKYDHTVDYNNGRAVVPTLEEDYSTSAGSVTRFTTVNINGGIIHRNVYGGGSLSTVGAPKIGQSYIPYRKGDTDTEHGEGKQSLNQVNIAGTIGTPDGYGNDNTFKYNPVYGGEVYGASRGDVSLGSTFSNAVWTEVNLLPGARVQGNVFGGGDSGPVKQDSEVNVGVTFNIASTDIEDDAMSISQAGGESNKKTITVTSNATWEVKSSASWLTVRQKSGDGNGTITVTATANNGEGATPRTATITISAPGQTKTITVTQAGGS